MMNFLWQMKLVLLLWAICISWTNLLPHVPSCLLSSPRRRTHTCTNMLTSTTKDDSEHKSRWPLWCRAHRAKPKDSFNNLVCLHAHAGPQEWAEVMFFPSEGLYRMSGVSANRPAIHSLHTHCSLSATSHFSCPNHSLVWAWSSHQSNVLARSKASHCTCFCPGRCLQCWGSLLELWSCSSCPSRREAALTSCEDAPNPARPGSVTWRHSPRSKSCVLGGFVILPDDVTPSDTCQD